MDILQIVKMKTIRGRRRVREVMIRRIRKGMVRQIRMEKGNRRNSNIRISSRERGRSSKSTLLTTSCFSLSSHL